MKDKLFIISIGAGVLLIAGLAIWSIPRLATREKECTQKDGVMIRSYGGYMCIKKDVVIK